MGSEFTFNGIKIYKGMELITQHCDVFSVRTEICRIDTLWNTYYSTISIVIFDKLGFDLSTEEGLEISKKKNNRNKVVCVWNNLVKEFDNVEEIIKKLKEPNFNSEKYLEGFVEKKSFFGIKPIKRELLEGTTWEKKAEEINNEVVPEETGFVNQLLKGTTWEKKAEEINTEVEITNENSSVENNSVFIGNTKQIKLFEESLKIGTTGDFFGKMRAASGTTTVDVFYSDIRSVVVQQPNAAGALLSGFGGGGLKAQMANIANSLPYIRILLKGTENYSNQNFRPADDPYSVTFSADKKNEAEKIKLKIDELISKHRQSNNNSNVVNQISVADELEKFSNLLKKGIITQEEFDLKKKQLLGL